VTSAPHADAAGRQQCVNQQLRVRDVMRANPAALAVAARGVVGLSGLSAGDRHGPMRGGGMVLLALHLLLLKGKEVGAVWRELVL